MAAKIPPTVLTAPIQALVSEALIFGLGRKSPLGVDQPLGQIWAAS